MSELKISSLSLSYKDIMAGNTYIKDCYNVFSTLTETRKIAFYANPNLDDESQDFIYLNQVDGVAGGIAMLYPTKAVIDGIEKYAQTGSALYVVPDFRHLALGADIMIKFSMGTKYDYSIASGISEIALPLYKKLRFKILEFPRMMSLRRSRCILEAKGLNGIFLKISSSLIDIPLKIINGYFNIKSKRLTKQFTVTKETIIPEWVDDMIKADNHKYAEVHDRKWLQWNLDYNFHGLERDIQSFYSIKKDDKPIGFLMTKERFRELAGGKIHNVRIGSIVEWQSINENVLSESIINKLAIHTFSDDIDIIEFATADKGTIKSLSKWMFLKHGSAHIAFRDKTKTLKDASDINMWRVRYGYADVILT